ncbi:MAG: hypothetical protein IKI71_03770, partial [Lachnospiraceae bacterium]|nr:hypothetical protein [Lachnospiraceae bacterium]
MMCFDVKKRKMIALVLIVSQLIVNAGMQTFAVSFSKIVDNTLDAMQQPENISTKYYEEFYYESKTYLFNDGNEDNEDETNFDTANQNDEIENNNDDKENDGVGASETTVGAKLGESEEDTGASTESPDEDDEDEADTQEYEEEPEEDTVEYEEEPEEDETDDVPIDGDYEDVPEEILDDETTVDETEEDVETTEESGTSETR